MGVAWENIVLWNARLSRDQEHCSQSSGTTRVFLNSATPPTLLVSLSRPPAGVAVLSRATAIEQSAQLSTWDALLVAACCEAGVRRLHTEDIQSRQVIEGIEIVHPFG